MDNLEYNQYSGSVIEGSKMKQLMRTNHLYHNWLEIEVTRNFNELPDLSDSFIIQSQNVLNGRLVCFNAQMRPITIYSSAIRSKFQIPARFISVMICYAQRMELGDNLLTILLLKPKDGWEAGCKHPCLGVIGAH